VAPKSEPPSWPALATPANAKKRPAVKNNLFINSVVDFGVCERSRGFVGVSGFACRRPVKMPKEYMELFVSGHK
jgi:hypothetical protein